MGKSAVVAGTGFEGRASIIQRYCKEGKAVVLKREPGNQHDPNAVAVYLAVPRLFGLLGTSRKKIGYIKASKSSTIAKKMDAGEKITGYVKYCLASEGREFPKVTLDLEY